jgi:hypothetical protein
MVSFPGRIGPRNGYHKAAVHFAALQNAQRITTAQDGRPFEPV